MIVKPFRVVRLDLPFDARFDAAMRADPDVALEVLGVHQDDETIWASLERAHAYQVSSAKDELPPRWRVGPALLARCPELLCVSTYGAGYDTVDVAACTAAGVCVLNQAGSNARAVAEHTMGLLLGLTRRIAECDRALRRGERFARHAFMGRDLHTMTMGLVGIGHAGREVARLAQAFGMRVVATDPWLSREEIAHRGATAMTLQELLACADVVSLHCPLNDETAGMLGRAQFARMKKGALFISTARGGIHDEAALHEAIVDGTVDGAALDVWSVEPPPATHPLLSLPRVIATHHIAGVTHGARAAMAEMAARQLREFAQGQRPLNLVNPDAWPAFVKRMPALLAGIPGR